MDSGTLKRTESKSRSLGMGRSKLLLMLVAGACLLAVSGCIKVVSSLSSGAGSAYVKAPAGSPGDSLIKMSMNHYHDLKSLSASCAWGMSSMPFAGGSVKRSISYVAPNEFKVEMTSGMGMTMSAVSDGKKLVELSSVSPGQSYAAPSDLADATSMEMQHPMFCGSLLYKFFSGSSGYDKVVDEAKGKPVLGKEEQADGETAQHVKFYAAGDTYGNTDVLIGEQSGNVYSISYDSDALMKKAKDMGFGSTLKGYETTETYSDIKLNPSITAATFDTTAASKGQKVTDMSAEMGGNGQPPVPLGSTAPPLTVTPVAGGAPVTLDSLRGKPVLIDFWATWCPPCRESLPHTQDIFKDLGSKGLQVMTVSDEKPETITAFLKKNNYTFPAFRDEGDKVTRAYGVSGIPTVVIIDKDGKLQSYLVGLRDESELREALKKIGVS
jgi:peroxiredoxin/outer membrane lipoprotein-sorting protein